MRPRTPKYFASRFLQKSKLPPPVTRLVIAVALGIYTITLMRELPQTWDDLRRFGVLPPDEIWNGAYWSVISSSLVHFSPLELGVLAFWMNRFGRRAETKLGPARYFAFIFAATFISGSAQLATAGFPSNGLAGVVYALFGYVWILSQDPRAEVELHPAIIGAFLVWLVFIKALGEVELSEGSVSALVAGLVFGCAVGNLHHQPPVRWVATAFAATISFACLVSLFWAPWQPNWLHGRGAARLDSEDFQGALEDYNDLIARDPSDAYGYWGRAYAQEALGNHSAGLADRTRALELDPSLEDNAQ